MYQVLFCLTDQHDWRLVALGGAVCLLASAAAISLFHRARATQGRRAAGLDRAGCRRSAAAASGRRTSSRCWPTARATALATAFRVTILSLIFAILRHLRRTEHRGVVLADAVGRPRRRHRRRRRRGDALHRHDGAGDSGAHRLVVGIVIASVLFGIVFGALALFVASQRTRRARPFARRDRPADARHRLASFHRDGRRDADRRSDARCSTGFDLAGLAVVPGRRLRGRHSRHRAGRRR